MDKGKILTGSQEVIGSNPICSTQESLILCKSQAFNLLTKRVANPIRLATLSIKKIKVLMKPQVPFVCL